MTSSEFPARPPRTRSSRPRSNRTRALLALAILLALALLALLLAPSPLEDAAAWDPEPGPGLDGAMAPGDAALAGAELVAKGKVRGPEDVAVDSRGRVYGGLEDGRIVRITDPGGPDETVEIFADTGGRPLGLAWEAAGEGSGRNMLVADAVRGLLRVSPEGEVTTLATEAAEVPFGFTDDVDIGPDGTVYFSDASWKWGIDEYLYDLLEARPHGRLLAWDPVAQIATVLLDDLYFANGVAVSPAGDLVLINETYRYRVRRLWLEGPRAGESEIFIDELPGFPDGVSTGRDPATGETRFWLALYTVRNPLVDDVLHPRPYWKSRLALLPRFLWPRPEPYGLVVGLDREGRIRESYHDPTGEHLREITSVEQHGDDLWLGTLHGDRIGRLTLPR